MIKKGVVDTIPLPPKGSRTTVWDREIKGFGVRVASTGVRTYILRYRMGGRDTPVRTVTIGQHGSPWTADQARRRAAELLTEVRSGRDIVAEKEALRVEEKEEFARREERLFEVVVEQWFEDHVQRDELRSEDDIRGVIDRDLKPAFAGRTIDEITRKDVTRALSAIGRRSGSAANKAHKWIRQIFNWLIGQGDIEHSPVDKVERPFPEPSRDRVLRLGELVVLWVALDRIVEPFRTYYRFLILLGQRLREASDAPWSEFDLEVGDWLLPTSRTKSKRDHLVPLSEQAIELLEGIQPDPRRRRGPVFTTNGSVGISGFSKMKAEIDAAIADLLAESEAARALVGDALPHWVVHDVRRSLSTGCQAMGIDLMHTEAILNHVIGKKASGAARVYHLYDYYDEKAVALEKWGDLVEKAVAAFRRGDVEAVRAMDPARRAKRRERRRRGGVCED
ncbi:site-specific integrase [Sphingomonas sp.]|uniref:tyrosine-type recombinase/integrase n=1 Tax=Sphingomonas sp. TaxID=28214 RepID=UPI0025E83FF0|nr:site-specific integrase [Sphingomonas sp.]